jgi:hypothetical protein
MTYLELSPAITALRSRPEEFELQGDALHHLGSRHSFRFLSADELRIEALCGCVQLRASRDQSRDLHEAFRQWRSSYWQPLQINREFAAHFEPPGLFRRGLMALLRYLIAWRPEPKVVPLDQPVPLR